MQKLCKTILFLFFFVLLFSNSHSLITTSAQSPIRCGLLNEACCNFAGSAPNSCKQGVGLTCNSGKCVPDGTVTNPPDRSDGNTDDDRDLCSYVCRAGETTTLCKQCRGEEETEEPDTTTTTSNSSAFPQIKLPCDKIKSIEFHSLRPYQAAACGDANKAYLCSNDLIFIESFDVEGINDCVAQGDRRDFICHPGITVDEHSLFIQLDNSMLPILGNTEQVTNNQGGSEEFDDATKVNEYASWYLSGVNNKAEYGENTDDRVVNYSGPIQKLLPKMIQEAERLETIMDTIDLTTYKDEDTGESISEPENHNQVVVCADKQFLNIFGKSIPEPCYEATRFRLKEWTLDLSRMRSVSNFGLNILEKLPSWIKGPIGNIIDESTSVAWNKRFPPLPWKDDKGEPFKTDLEYKKAYQEWQGKSCVIVLKNLVCVDNPGVTNTFADLYQYIPLANTVDKKGAQMITDVQPRGAAGTVISGFEHGDELVPAALWMAHTEEVKQLSELLNTTYSPKDIEKVSLPNSTEPKKCSVVNVRTNPGDNLFPGDPLEMEVPGVTYTIDEALCKERTRTVTKVNRGINFPCVGKPVGASCDVEISSVTCNAQVYITLKTVSKTANAKEIFDNTVAGSNSTFRKIFPKVEAGAPVSCIASIPTVTNVDYDTSKTQNPTYQGGKGEVTFKYKKIPEDGAGEGAELTFPHIGSVYEYFLNGIQTALRPKGYGEPIVDGTLCNNIKCGELPELPKASGSCNLGSVSSRVGEIPENLKEIVSAAAETYKVPPALVIGVLYGESAFNRSDKNGAFSKYQWTEENVTNWATCESLPQCEGPETSLVKFFENNWNEMAKAIEPDLNKLDPNKKFADPCNLIDAIYALTWDLHRNAFGVPAFAGHSCFGIPLNSGTSTNMNGCSWDDRDIETSIRWWEFGTGYNSQYMCATLENSCATGGGGDANCTTGDDCETVNFRYSNPSHNACVFDVAHGN